MLGEVPTPSKNVKSPLRNSNYGGVDNNNMGKAQQKYASNCKQLHPKPINFSKLKLNTKNHSPEKGRENTEEDVVDASYGPAGQLRHLPAKEYQTKAFTQTKYANFNQTGFPMQANHDLERVTTIQSKRSSLQSGHTTWSKI